MKVEIHIDPACTEPTIVIHAAQMTEEIESLVRRLSSPAPEMLPVQTARGVELLPVDKIIRIYTECQKVCIQTPEDIYPVKFRLYEMEEKLKGLPFARISSSEIVNIKMITGMDFSFAGTIRIALKGGITTYVSRRHVSQIKKLFNV